MDSVFVWTLDLGLLGMLIVLSAFFSGSETAFFSLTGPQRIQLREERSRSSQTILTQLEYPQRLLITILVGNMIVNIFASSYCLLYTSPSPRD